MLSLSNESFAIPCFADVYMMGKSSCSSLAPNSKNKSIISFMTSGTLESGLSVLLITTIGFNSNSNAFFNTNLV